jgi:hypothetical protein
MNQDEDLIRIKNKLNWFNNIFKQGPINMLINVLVSYLVTLEITNGTEKITIQEIMTNFKARIEEMNKNFEELCFFADTVKDPEQITLQKNKFRLKLYKLFDLSDLLNILIKKSVTMASSLQKITAPLLDTIFKPLTANMIDTIFLTDTEEEFEKKIIDYLNERVDTIEPKLNKKLRKIKILHKILKQIVEEPIDDNSNLSDSEMIEMQ